MSGEIAIVGAGPAGAALAQQVAAAGGRVTLFDDRAPWEKPCGGVLGRGTLEEHPILRDYPYPVNQYRSVTYVSPKDERTSVSSPYAIPVVSRRELATHLLDQAQRAGATFRQERMLSVERTGSRWTLQTSRGRYTADFIVGADGTRSMVRRTLLGKISKPHLSLCCGYFLTGVPSDDGVMKFLDVEGYLWIVSCCSHTSAGILAALPTASTRDLFSKLDAYLSEHYPHASRLERWVALVPTAQDPSLFDQACCGENWALLGDAAGHADPLLAEGIYYAFRSARLAAQALLEGDLTSYDTAWRDTYGHRLTANARRRSDAKRLLGGSSELMGYMLYRYFMEVAAYAQRT